MQISLAQALLVLVFRAARLGRRANLTAFCRRFRVDVPALEMAFEELEAGGLLRRVGGREQLTFEGLAVAAALSKHWSEAQRLLAACQPLAA